MYYEYIRSHEWRDRANHAKRQAGYRCRVYNKPASTIQLDAHHRTYERNPDDIAVAVSTQPVQANPGSASIAASREKSSVSTNRCITRPAWCPSSIKGNIGYNTGEKIYHVSSAECYAKTKKLSEKGPSVSF